jgi:hypothetical protein
MRSRNIRAALIAATVLGLGLACSGMPTGGGGTHANVAACKKYVEAFNGAACNAVDLNADDLCPSTLDMTPCDMTPYYKCMADAVKCNGEFLDISGQANCSMPACN